MDTEPRIASTDTEERTFTARLRNAGRGMLVSVGYDTGAPLVSLFIVGTFAAVHRKRPRWLELALVWLLATALVWGSTHHT